MPDGLRDNDANDWSRVRDRSSVGRFPAEGDRVAGVPDLELFEVDGWLLGLASLELSTAGKGCTQERESDGGGALWTGVDEGVDALGIVGVGFGERSVSERVAVVGDEGAEVGGDLLSFVSRHAVRLALLQQALQWPGEGAGDSQRKGEDA